MATLPLLLVTTGLNPPAALVKAARQPDPWAPHRALINHISHISPTAGTPRGDHDYDKTRRGLLSPREVREAADDVTTHGMMSEDEFLRLPRHQQQLTLRGLAAARHALRHGSLRVKRTNEQDDLLDAAGVAREHHTRLSAARHIAELAQHPAADRTRKFSRTLRRLGVRSRFVVNDRDLPDDHPARSTVFHHLFGSHTPEDIKQAFSAQGARGYKATLRDIHHRYNPDDAHTAHHFYVGGEVTAPNGQWVGDYKRSIDMTPRGKIHVHHDHLIIENDKHKGAGVATGLLRNSFKLYQKLGVHEVSTDPAMDGRYVWPRMGFHWGEGGTAAVHRTLPGFLADHGMTRKAAKEITKRHANKPWEVAALHIPVGNARYEGQHKIGKKMVHFYSTPKADSFVEGTNAPEWHPAHDPKLGKPMMHVGKSYLLSEHGHEIWDNSGGATMRMHDSNPGYRHLKRYLGI